MRQKDILSGSSIFCLSLIGSLTLSLTADGPRPTQKEIISLRAFMLLFLKQLILKVCPTCLHASQPRTRLDFELWRGNMEIVNFPCVIL